MTKKVPIKKVPIERVDEVDSNSTQNTGDVRATPAKKDVRKVDRSTPEWVTRQKQGLERPWIDPIDAVAGPLGFTRKVGAKAATKAVAGSVATEPLIGGLQGKVSDALSGLPEIAKMPINMLTGFMVGDLLTASNRKVGKMISPGRGDKSKALKEMGIEGKTQVRNIENLPTIEKSLTEQGAAKVGGLYTKYIGSPIWDKLVMEQAPKLLEKVPGGKAVNKAMIYDYRGDLPNTKEYMDLKEGMETNTGLGAEYAIDLGNRIQSLPESDQLKLGKYIKGEPDIAPEGSEVIPDDIKGLGDEVKDTFLKLGKQSVDAGLMSEETFFKRAGQYMPRLYTSKEYQKNLNKFGTKKPNRMDLQRFKERKDIPPEIREEMGEILKPGYPVAKGITQLTKDIQQAKFFSSVANMKGWSVPKKTVKEQGEKAIPPGFMQLPKNKKLGELSEAHVHPEIYNDLNDVVKSISKGEDAWRKALGAWKFGKVVASPKTHMRNMMSNSILAHLGGLSMTEQPRYMKEAVGEFINKGDYWKAAKEQGLLDSSFVQKEMGQLFGGVAQQMKGIESHSLQDTVGIFGKALEGAKAGARKASDLYQAEEQWFKMSKFIHNIEKKGMDVESAAKDAEKWLFNYGKLTRFQDAYRKHPLGAPFATFTFKAIPRVAESAAKYPWRFAAPLAMINGIQEVSQQVKGDTDEQAKAKRKLIPDWMQGGTSFAPNFLRMPVSDEHGRDYYLNLSYILPWGDIAEGGGALGIPGSLRPLSQPFTNELAEQIANYDVFHEEPIVKETETAGKTGKEKMATMLKERGLHTYRTLAPTLFRDAEKMYESQKGMPDYRGRVRPEKISTLDVFGGIKMYPVDYAERVTQLIQKHSPSGGRLANRLRGQMNTLATKMEAASKQGKNDLVAKYEKQMDKIIKQLEGLADKTATIGKTYQKTK